MPNDSPQVRAALLDIDGTLVDSNDHHAHAWVDAFCEAGYSITFDQVRPLVGMGGDKIIPTLVGIDVESDEGKRISERRSSIFFERYVSRIQAWPQSRALIERMGDAGLTLVIATSANQDEYESLSRIAGVADLVDDKTTADDANRSKPDPDIIVAALEKGKCAPDEAVMLGDTPYDVQSAQRASVACVALRSGGWSDSELAGAIAIYDDPADLLAQFETSPFAAGRTRMVQ